uniref:Uncharacterized protein n=1 Tax=Anopheles quadriannulatus TaxID=34691 RepID=A0A182XSR8_ANOQN
MQIVRGQPGRVVERRILVRLAAEHIERVDLALGVFGRLSRSRFRLFAFLFRCLTVFLGTFGFTLAQQHLGRDQLQRGRRTFPIFQPHAEPGQHIVPKLIAQLQDFGRLQTACLLPDRIAELCQRLQPFPWHHRPLQR